MSDNKGRPELIGEYDELMTDEKGRPSLANMSDSEKLDEILVTLRQVTDLIDSFVSDFQSGRINPMQMIGQLMRGGR